MAQYKVPQNVESEDKILGPLSLRQFIYVIIALMWGFLMWRLFSHALVIAVILGLPVSGMFLALGLIQREEQSFENYFIAMVRFVVVPRQRVWHKDDIRDVFKTAAPPKKPELTLGQRNPEQVKGQLEKLALIVDTRGRQAKPADLQLPDAQNQAASLSARVNVSAQTPEPAAAKVSVQDDILDMQNNRQAQAVGQLLENVETRVREQAQAAMQQAAKQPAPTNAAPAQPIAQPPAASDPSPEHNQNAILDLAMHRSGLSVAQIASAANRTPGTLTENQPVQLRQ